MGEFGYCVEGTVADVGDLVVLQPFVREEVAVFLLRIGRSVREIDAIPDEERRAGGAVLVHEVMNGPHGVAADLALLHGGAVKAVAPALRGVGAGALGEARGLVIGLPMLAGLQTGITGALQHAGQRGTFRDEMRGVVVFFGPGGLVEDDAGHMRIPPGEQRAERGTAHGRGDVALRETQRLRGEAVDVRRVGDLAAHEAVFVPRMVVGEEEDDVGFVGGVGKTTEDAESEEKGEELFHKGMELRQHLCQHVPMHRPIRQQEQEDETAERSYCHNKPGAKSCRKSRQDGDSFHRDVHLLFSTFHNQPIDTGVTPAFRSSNRDGEGTIFDHDRC